MIDKNALHAGRTELLSSLESERTKPQNLNLSHLITAISVVLIILALCIPKIYIANEIYYASRDIDLLKNTQSVLKEEQKALRSRLEAIRYKNQIINHLH